MSELEIPSAAVEAAAKALSKAAYGDFVDWAEVPEMPRGLFIRDARAALQAAAPSIIAQALREAADELEYGNPITSWLTDRADTLVGGGDE